MAAAKFSPRDLRIVNNFLWMIGQATKINVPRPSELHRPRTQDVVLLVDRMFYEAFVWHDGDAVQGDVVFKTDAGKTITVTVTMSED